MSGRQRLHGPSRQIRRTKNGCWTDEQLQSALANVDNGLSMRKVSQKNGTLTLRYETGVMASARPGSVDLHLC